ncbi:MAG: acetyl-CoA hydrolase/transferase family protein [Acidobacteria bacterium]|nr:acetyl-CoA hydrolase/transferase family protein [Acidobacteriota bacterium]
MSQYKQRLCSADEAVSSIKSGDWIYTSSNAAAPRTLREALARRKNELRGVTLMHGLLIEEDPLARAEMAGHFRHNSLFVGFADRDAVQSGRADYLPVFLHEVPGLFTSRRMPINVVILHTTMPDEHGFMSLGTEVLAARAALENAETVIVQANEKMPRTLGDSFIHISSVHRIVEVSEELPVLEKKGYTDVEKRIGEHIGEMVEDGSTLQLGIGGIPDAVLAALRDKKNLGIHTEMISDGVKEGVEAGFITGSKKTLHPGKVIGTFVLGSRQLYDYVNNNPVFELHPTNYTNNPLIIARNEKMVSVNSAIEIDVTGQVCSDSIGPYIYSGFGGQVDFVRGASMAREGKPIIALPSTARNGTVSRIVPYLKKGAGVVTSRADVHYVVTEYGAANLHGKNLRERFQALTAITHPDFREDLEKAARERKLI